jgi:protoheme IX farnesyltransferase
VNPVAAALAATAMVYYIAVYTLLLKQRTRWSALIGSGVGAITPLIGWVAVTGRINLTPVLLSVIVLLWTPPHFWSFAVLHQAEYEQAGLTVLPLKGVAFWITGCSLLLAGTALLLGSTAGLGRIYLVTASLLSAGLLYLALQMNRREHLRIARWLYIYSIIYIFSLFAVVIIDRLVY